MCCVYTHVPCSYVTFAIGVVAEMIALLLVCPTVDRIGRHNLLAFGQLLGGGACIGCALVNDGIAQAILAGIGKFGCSGEVGRLAVMIVTIKFADFTSLTCSRSCEDSAVPLLCSGSSSTGHQDATFIRLTLTPAPCCLCLVLQSASQLC